ncbi:hypothetical protein D3C83_121590 [compost metagenome]
MRDLQSITAVGGSLAQCMQEDDPIPMFHGREVHVGGAVECLRKFGQFDKMGGKQRE